MSSEMNADWLTVSQQKCLRAFDSSGRILPTRTIAYALRPEDRRITAVKRKAWNIMNNFRARGYAEATVFLGECRWALTSEGNKLRLALIAAQEPETSRISELELSPTPKETTNG